MVGCFVDKFSAHNTMNINVISFPLRADGNSVQHDFCDEAEGNSATRRFFRPSRMGRFCTQALEITRDDFSATAKNKSKPEFKFTAPMEPDGAEVRLGLNRLIREVSKCWL